MQNNRLKTNENIPIQELGIKKNVLKLVIYDTYNKTSNIMIIYIRKYLHIALHYFLSIEYSYYEILQIVLHAQFQ